ncbi:hypothetical protein KC19_VG037700 [Ceratodon purpureus]|uniref:Uncharacterized protein n=1 Tax=Ceratodon purpureus TaxID=3225 RepID=A0A8T0HM46_CERPU|nr:hypothetical protein KC19_VG037700 [Ceratodon purpureus]
MPDDSSKRSWNEFVRKVASNRANPNWNRANPNWNRAQRDAVAACTHHNLLGSGGIDSFNRDFMERYGMRPPYEYVHHVREIGRERFREEFNQCGFGDVHDDEEEEADFAAESSET